MIMANRAVKLIDALAGALVMAAFAAFGMLICAVFPLKKRRLGKSADVVQIYISIIDFRKSVLSTYKEDILIDGFIKKSLCFHMDFELEHDDKADISDGISMSVVSVHPDTFFARAGFRKLTACWVEIRTLCAMIRAAFREHATVVRAHDPHLLGFNALIISRLAGIPCIIQVCSNYELKDRQAKGLTCRPFMFKALERWFERFIMNSADMVLTDREHYRSFGIIPKNIPLTKYVNMGFFVDAIHYAPVLSRTSMRSSLGISQDTKVLLYVGRLCRVKYVLDLMSMFELCLKERTDIVLLLAGDGDLKDEMKARAGRGGFLDKVIFLDRVPQDKLPDLYYTADTVCFTSSGFTMIEAALAERCIIAYDFEWHDEFIGKNERGMLVPFGDCRMFAESVLKVLADESLRKDLGRLARGYALEHYTRAPSVEKERRAYKRLLGLEEGLS